MRDTALHFVDHCPMRERDKAKRCLHSTTYEARIHRFVWSWAVQRIEYRKITQTCLCNEEKYPSGRIVGIRVESSNVG